MSNRLKGQTWREGGARGYIEEQKIGSPLGKKQGEARETGARARNPRVSSCLRAQENSKDPKRK